MEVGACAFLEVAASLLGVEDLSSQEVVPYLEEAPFQVGLPFLVEPSFRVGEALVVSSFPFRVLQRLYPVQQGPQVPTVPLGLFALLFPLVKFSQARHHLLLLPFSLPPERVGLQRSL